MSLDSEEKQNLQGSNCYLSNVNLPLVKGQNDTIKDNIKDNLKDNNGEALTARAVKASTNNPEVEELGSLDNPIAVKKEWLVDRYNNLTVLTNGLYMYGNKFYKMEDK